MKNLLIGAAIAALAAGPLGAQGNGHGKGPSGGHGNAPHGPAAQGPAAHGPALNGPSMKAAPGHGAAHGRSGQAPGSMASAMEASAPQHGKSGAHAHGNGKGGPMADPAAGRKPGDRGRSAMTRAADAGPPALSPGKGKGRAEHAATGQASGVKVLPDGRHYYASREARETFDFAAARPGLISGCPPGLAKKNNGCLPPGQAARYIGHPLGTVSRIAALESLPSAFRPLYLENDDYYDRYGGGYLYRVDRSDNLINSMVPLFGAALLGQPMQPYYANNYYRPSYYNAFYPNTAYDCYQYGYGYVYNTNCANGLVQDVIPTYDNGYGVGQILPSSYGYYNVPYAYRGSYYDSGDYSYRYAPGAIYQVDRSTSLISAVAALLTGGLTVGQPLPTGYSAYNVPYAYRTTYYDTPDTWYRYNNGYIYAVDPTTQLVTSIARAIV